MPIPYKTHQEDKSFPLQIHWGLTQTVTIENLVTTKPLGLSGSSSRITPDTPTIPAWPWERCPNTPGALAVSGLCPSPGSRAQPPPGRRNFSPNPGLCSFLGNKAQGADLAVLSAFTKVTTAEHDAHVQIPLCTSNQWLCLCSI